MTSLERQLRESVRYIAERNRQLSARERNTMTTTAIEKHEGNGNGRDYGQLVESVVIHGDLSQLKPQERASYYSTLCQSIGLNPLTRPFEYLKLNGREILYARKDATDQLRSNRRVSITIEERETIDGVYVVTARATTPEGRTDESTGAVNIKGLTGDNLANAMMKAETKAKRRVTLSICGLGFLDETELETIPFAQPRAHLPHGEPAEGVELLENIDEVVSAIEAAESMADLGKAWTGETAIYERYSEADRKKIGQAYHRAKRRIQKADRELDKGAETATEGDDL